MAVKIFGSCSGSSGSKYNIWLEITENSHSISKNTSNLTVNLKLKRNDGYSSSAYNLNENENYSKITINNTTKTSQNLEIDTRNSVTLALASWTGDVTHNADGSLTITVGGSFTMSGTSLSGGDVSGSFKCITIPRASGFSTDKASVNPDEEITLTITPASKNFTHELIYEMGDYKSKVSLSTGTETTSFSIPALWVNALPNAKQGTIKLTLKTYNSSTSVGATVKYLKIVIPEIEEYLPEFKIKATYNKNGIVPDDWSVLLQNISTITLSLSDVNCKYGAEVANSYITLGSSKKYGLLNEFDLPDSGVVTATARLVDTRGFFSEQKFSFNVEKYAKPTLTCNNIYRCDSSGTPSSTGLCAAIEFKKIFSSVRTFNNGYVNARYKKSTDSEYSDSITLSSSPFIISGDFQENSSYDFVISIYDSVTKTPFEITRTLPSGNIPFNIKSGGKGAAFGCFAETDNELTIGYNLNIKGELKYTDLSESVVYESCVKKDKMLIKKFDSLGITHIKAKFTVTSPIAANTWATLGTITDFTIEQLCPIPTTIEYYIPTKIIAGIMNIQGEIRVICSEGFSVGDVIYINGIFS